MKLPSIEEYNHYIEKNHGQQNQLDLIENLLAYYLVEQQKRVPQFQTLMTWLNRLEKSIFVWFDQNKAPDLKKVPNGPFMLKLMKDVETEHERLVDFAVKEPKKFIPVDLTGLDMHAVAAIYKLWNSIVAGNGNIAVLGTKEFQKKTYAHLAKLMQGEYGRTMLQYLDGGVVNTSNRISIAEDFDTQLNKANLKGEEPEGSYALSRALLKDHNSKDADVKPESVDMHYQVVATLDGVNQAIMAGLPGVNYKGKSYTFRKGSGSLVKITKDEGRPDVNANLQQAVTPGFITLGHELGHAMRNKGGASFQNLGTEDYEGLLQTEEGAKDDDSKSLWTNAEELVNINTVENKLRGEHRLPTRKYHASQERARYLKFTRKLAQVYSTPLNDAEKLMVRQSAFWGSDIAPALQINDPKDWTDAVYRKGMTDLDHLHQNVIPVAKQKAIAHVRLEHLRVTYSGILTAHQFNHLPDVVSIKQKITGMPYNHHGVMTDLDHLEAALKSKWWKTMSLRGVGVVVGLAAAAGGLFTLYKKYSK